MKAVFLDRDGVLNEAIVRNGKSYPPTTLDELVVSQGAAPALNALRRQGFRLIMATNQPDIARKKILRETVAAINRHICAVLPIDAVEMCQHDDSDDCDCRKPRPGMLVRAARRDGLDLSASYMVGDRWRDIEAGRNAHCRTILIGAGCDEGIKSQPDAVVGSLAEAVDWILTQEGRGR
jgi:D-glycero-D-manno-heptose 1,7-bisphosphate phosphatase